MSPWEVVQLLRELGLITDQQAEEAFARFQVELDEYNKAHDAFKARWRSEASWWTRFWSAGEPRFREWLDSPEYEAL